MIVAWKRKANRKTRTERYRKLVDVSKLQHPIALFQASESIFLAVSYLLKSEFLRSPRGWTTCSKS